MSKEIQTSHPDIVLTEFFGGLARGTCIQINTADRLAESDSIQLTRLQAEALALALIDWLTPAPAALTEEQLERLRGTVRASLARRLGREPL